jgi:Copper binding proteins, plastocyanin/azurin family
MKAALKTLYLPLLGLALACGVGLSAARSNAPGEPRAITLTARDMAFYRPGDPTPNPLTLDNQDRGMPHDFAVATLDLATDPLHEAGTTTSVVFEAPDQPGDREYVCTFHAGMMKGVLRVE